MGNGVLCDAFCTVVELIATAGAERIHELLGIWAWQLADDMAVYVNGHDQAMRIAIAGRGEHEIEPHAIEVWQDGWQIAYIDPYHAEWSDVTEEVFIEAVNAEIGRLQGVGGDVVVMDERADRKGILREMRRIEIEQMRLSDEMQRIVRRDPEYAAYLDEGGTLDIQTFWSLSDELEAINMEFQAARANPNAWGC